MLEIIKLVLIAVAKFFGWQEKDRMLNAGNAEQKAKNAEEVVDAIKKVDAAKSRVRDTDAGATSTDQLPDDGFRRD